jgi:hypothetical protein
VTVEEQKVRELLQQFTPYPTTTVSVADVEQRLPVRRVTRRATTRRWTPLIAAAVVVALAGTVALIAHSRTSAPRPVHGVSPPALPVDLGSWRATGVLSGEFEELISAGSSLLTVDNDRLLRVVPGHGVRASAQLPRDSWPSIAFDGHNVWVAVYLQGGGQAVILRRYSYPALTLQRSVTLRPGEPRFGPLVLVGAPGEILVGSGEKVVTVRSTDLSTLGTLTLDGDVNGLAWREDGHLYAAGPGEHNVVEDYTRTGPGSYTLRRTVPGAGPPLAGSLVVSDRGLWEISQFNSYNLKFASFADLAHPAAVVPMDTGDVTVTVAGGTAWIGGTILGCANPDTGHLRTPIHQVVDHTGATSVLGPIASLHGQLYAVYSQYKKARTVQTAIVKLQPPSACRSK